MSTGENCGPATLQISSLLLTGPGADQDGFRQISQLSFSASSGGEQENMEAEDEKQTSRLEDIKYYTSLLLGQEQQ